MAYLLFSPIYLKGKGHQSPQPYLQEAHQDIYPIARELRTAFCWGSVCSAAGEGVNPEHQGGLAAATQWGQRD